MNENSWNLMNEPLNLSSAIKIEEEVNTEILTEPLNLCPGEKLCLLPQSPVSTQASIPSLISMFSTARPSVFMMQPSRRIRSAPSISQVPLNLAVPCISAVSPNASPSSSLSALSPITDQISPSSSEQAINWNSVRERSQTSGNKDSTYRQRRLKNNEAARRSRQKKKQQELATQEMLKICREENERLRVQNRDLTEQVHELRTLLYNHYAALRRLYQQP